MMKKQSKEIYRDNTVLNFCSLISINQPIDRSIKQPTNQSTDLPTNQPTDRSTNRPIIQSTIRSIHQSINPSIDHYNIQSTNFSPWCKQINGELYMLRAKPTRLSAAPVCHLCLFMLSCLTADLRSSNNGSWSRFCLSLSISLENSPRRVSHPTYKSKCNILKSCCQFINFLLIYPSKCHCKYCKKYHQKCVLIIKTHSDAGYISKKFVRVCTQLFC